MFNTPDQLYNDCQVFIEQRNSPLVTLLFLKQLLFVKFVKNIICKTMKKLRFFGLALSLTLLLSSCGMMSNIFKGKTKTGCPSNGKNVGAEKIMSGDPKAMKDVKKAKKFKS